MDEQDRIENNNKLLCDMSLKELLDIATSRATRESLKEEIKMFICANYEHTTQFQFLQAVKELEKMEMKQFHRDYYMNVKTCARDIIQALDLEHIDSLPEIQKIVLQKIETAKTMP